MAIGSRWRALWKLPRGSKKFPDHLVEERPIALA
jgi:hypothetical protein